MTNDSGRESKAKQSRSQYRRIFFLGAALGFLFTAIGALIAAAQIEATNTPEFCASCHEMEVFHETWQASTHGQGANGAVAAKCTDCHLPDVHEGLIHYLMSKGHSGAKDIICHLLGIQPDWIENLDRREVYTYESGCRKCHVELVAPDIPLKAFLAHRDYQLGETTKSCIACHFEQGHGDLKLELMRMRQTEAGASGLAP